MDPLSPALERTLLDVHGPAGRAWLDAVPSLVAACERAWDIRIGPPLPGLSYNFVATATRADGTEVVWKAGVPCREMRCEIAALSAYDGHGAARLLAADPDGGALLLERLRPGTDLWQTDDETAVPVVAEVMRRLWRPVPSGAPFPTVADWGEGFARMRAAHRGGSGPLPPALADAAERTFADLVASSDPPVLLHGDLHHGNVLRHGPHAWRAIDPKGLVGEPAYEPGAFLRNPLPAVLHGPHPERRMARRVALFAERLGLEPERIRAWGMAQAVLSAWWMVEDHGAGWEPAVRCARVLDAARAA